MYTKKIKDLNHRLKREDIDSGYADLFMRELEKKLPDQFLAFQTLTKGLKDKRIAYLFKRDAFRIIKMPYFFFIAYVLIHVDMQIDIETLLLVTSLFSPLIFYFYLKMIGKKFKAELLAIMDKPQNDKNFSVKDMQVDSPWYPEQKMDEIGKKAMNNFVLSFKVSRLQYQSVSMVKDKATPLGCAMICTLITMIYIAYTDGLQMSIQSVIEHVGYFCGWFAFSLMAFPYTEKFDLSAEQNSIIGSYCNFRDTYHFFINTDVDSYDKKIINELAKTSLYKDLDSLYFKQCYPTGIKD
jgi:hypothetical protein